MAYTKQLWTDNQTPVNAARLNYMENGIAAAALLLHTHPKSQITDMPTKLSQFTNDPGYPKAEFGTFTPKLINTVGGAVLNYTCGRARGYYYKTGGLVWISVNIDAIKNLSLATGGSGVSGLPFIAKSLTGGISSLAIGSWYDVFAGTALGDIPTAIVYPETNYISFMQTQGGNSLKFKQSTNNGYLYVAGCYLTDS